MKEYYKLINKIAKRAARLYLDYGYETDFLSLTMDIEYADKDTPMDLDALLAADNGNFAHDIGGIRRHLNRETGKLEDGFSPRYARGSK